MSTTIGCLAAATPRFSGLRLAEAFARVKHSCVRSSRRLGGKGVFGDHQHLQLTRVAVSAHVLHLGRDHLTLPVGGYDHAQARRLDGLRGGAIGPSVRPQGKPERVEERRDACDRDQRPRRPPGPAPLSLSARFHAAPFRYIPRLPSRWVSFGHQQQRLGHRGGPALRSDGKVAFACELGESRVAHERALGDRLAHTVLGERVRRCGNRRAALPRLPVCRCRTTGAWRGRPTALARPSE